MNCDEDEDDEDGNDRYAEINKSSCCSLFQDLFGKYQQVGKTRPSGYLGRINRHRFGTNIKDTQNTQKKEPPVCIQMGKAQAQAQDNTPVKSRRQ
ncbi:hypothetical protein AVEN_243370-1 [Araneus ventricosus]|uniref:Uncharacterized protein n=1 Tax=Araneus ventricosus TaxID=182803 RepID=A0A4Y2VSJ1_ARAVE|nr:hypothetical protein AVEN_243370-1 [Araneus ventricosus]